MDFSAEDKKKLSVAVDLGETNTAVSWALARKKDSKNPLLNKIETIRGYPQGINMGKKDAMSLEVPTQLLYPKGWRFRPLDELLGAPGPVDTLDVKSQSYNPRLRWGYEVSQVTSHITFQSNLDGTLVHRFKTLMDQSENHKQHNQALSSDLRLLSMNRTCQKEIPISEMVLLVTIDFLTKLLEFVKVRIYGDSNVSQTVPTEMVICVPVIWGQKAIRNMQLCMGLAAKLAGFPGLSLQQKSMDNVFIMAEPEAGATWILPGYLNDIQPRDIILVLDVGGGTTDAQTYIIDKTYPLRLEKQAIRHSGDSCGSNALNEAFFKLVRGLLDEHEYLENQPGVTRDGIARKLAFDDFENRIKKSWDMFNPEEPDCMFEVLGIRYDPSYPHDEGRPNRLTIPAGKIHSIFRDVCGKVSDILMDQLQTAHENNINIDKVVLIGGFALSKNSLCKRLQITLDAINNEYGRTCQIINHTDEHSGAGVDAIASGAVLRALNKEDGPKRVTKTAYGLGVYARYDEELHGNQKPIDGIQNPHEKWIKTIQWVSKLGGEVPPTEEKRYPRCCQFSYKDPDGERTEEFIIRDEIYLNDVASKDHYSIDHESNRGAEFIGYIDSDVSHLYHTFLDKRAKGPEGYTRGGHKFWEFHYELVYIIDGLNMKCIQRLGPRGEVLGELGVNIASALPSGAA